MIRKSDDADLAVSEAIRGVVALKRDLDYLVEYLPPDGQPAAIAKETRARLSEALTAWGYCAPRLVALEGLPLAPPASLPQRGQDGSK